MKRHSLLSVVNCGLEPGRIGHYFKFAGEVGIETGSTSGVRA